MVSPRRSAKQKSVSAELADAAPDVVPQSLRSDSHRDYLCERILTGSSMLADIDILEFLLLAMSRPQPQRLAQALLTRFDSFPRVIAAPVWDLLSVEGLGTDGVAVLKSIQLAALRLTRAEMMNKPVLGRWDRLMVYLHAELSRERVEQFRVLFLNNRGRVLADEVLQHGTVDHVRVEPRQVAERALELSATALILVHNRTSGDPTPTEDDIAMNEQIRTTAAVLSIELLDHIVMGDGCWFSFREKGLLDRTSALVGPAAERATPFLGYCHERQDAVVRASPKLGAAAPRARFQRSVRRKWIVVRPHGMQGTMSNQAKADRRELPGAAGRRGDAKFRDLSGARLAGCNMAGLDLSGACLRGADLRDAI